MPLDPNRWTQKTQEALAEAQRLAEQNSHAEVAPAHVLLAALGQDRGVTVPILERLDVEPQTIRTRLEEVLSRFPKAYGSSRPGVSKELYDAFTRAELAQREMGDEYLSVEHLLLALSNELGVERNALLTALREVRGSHRVTSQNPEEAYQSLE
jgi:ATP-dependent Clp protease ATP-binding subunit ClpB